MARLPAPTPAASLPAPSPVEVPMAEEAAPVVAPVSAKASKLSAKGKSAKSADEPIKVRATANGFFDCVRIRPGDVFEIKSMEQFSKRWMELV